VYGHGPDIGIPERKRLGEEPADDLDPVIIRHTEPRAPLPRRDGVSAPSSAADRHLGGVGHFETSALIQDRLTMVVDPSDDLETAARRTLVTP
jgi:hypothetical protein